VVARRSLNRIDRPGTAEDAWASWPELRRLPVAHPEAWHSVVVVAAHPDDEVLGVGGTMAMLADTNYRTPAETILKNGWVRPNKRIFNNAKVSDHFAIIPTLVAPKVLSEPEQKLYDLVTKRFLAIFYPAAEFLETNRITRVEGEPFKSAGKVLVRPAPAGTGIIAGGPMRAVFEALGVSDVVSKSLGTSNPYNMVRATFDALKNQQSPRMVAARRGRSVSEILARREDQAAEASA